MTVTYKVDKLTTLEVVAASMFITSVLYLDNDTQSFSLNAISSPSSCSIIS